MSLQLKSDSDNNGVNKEKLQLSMNGQTTGGSVSKEVNPWDNPNKDLEDLYDEPKVIYNSSMADLQGMQKQSNPVAGVVVKALIAFVVCAILLVAGKGIVSVVMPEGEDITALLTKKANVMEAELGLTFTDNPAWAANVVEYSESDPTVRGAAEGIGVVSMDGKQIGVHIQTKDYTMFGVQIGEGEKKMYDTTTYPYENFTSILDTMSGKATIYIYYNTSRNDCIFFKINNTTNRIESMTYYYDYKEVTEELSSI